MTGLFAELKRRNVFRVALAYVAASWLIIQVVETVFPIFGLADRLIRWVIIGLGVGFVPAVVLAWVFEWTPQGIVKESDIRPGDSVTPRTGRRLDRIIIVLLALAVGYFSFDKFILGPAREDARVRAAVEEVAMAPSPSRADDGSIVVLPFVNMSNDDANAYFADGISEEVLSLLARVEPLRVISRSSAFSYRGRNVDIPTVARELGVAHVLEGSVRKAGNQVRIAVQLVDARNDEQVWSESYDRQLDDIFVIQDDIAGRVVEALKVQLLEPAPRALETDPEAYAAFLRARALRRQNSKEALIEAQVLFREVLEIDPNYLPATDDLISVYINGSYTAAWPFDEGYENARALTESALEDNPDYARFWVQLGWIQAFYDGDLEAGARSYQRALRLDPHNLTSLGDTASFLQYIGRIDDSIRLQERTLLSDPLHPVIYANLANNFMVVGRAAEAEALLRKLRVLSPDYPNAAYMLSTALLLEGRYPEALDVAQQETDASYRLAAKARAQLSLGQQAAFDAGVGDLIDQHGDSSPYLVATVKAWSGAADEAFEWLMRARAQEDYMLGEAHTDPVLARLHSDPRWEPFLTELGTAPRQLAAIEFEFSLE